MSKIDLNTIQLIVENSMRAHGYSGGTIETGWKSNIPIPAPPPIPNAGRISQLIGQNILSKLPPSNFKVSVNLQSLRDSIAQSIYDTLTTTTVYGTLSSGMTTGQPSVQHVNAGVSINYDVSSNVPKNAARINDTVKVNSVSDQDFMTWVGKVSSRLSITAPSGIQGFISSGSPTVQIGD